MILQEDFIQKELQYWQIPGVSAGICTGSEVLQCAGYGVRDLRSGAPMTGDTLGAIASCSKSFTSAVIASLVEEGLLDYDRPVCEYIPEFQLMDPVASKQCTLRDMLYHRTGLAPHDAMWPEPGLSPEEYVRRVRYLEPNRPFRSSAQYNNTVYALAGAIAGIAAGKSWEELVKERIFAPLEMKRSCLTEKEMRESDDYATGYFGAERCSALSEMEPWEMDIAGPAAGVHSSAREMLSWLMLHINRGTFRGKRLFLSQSMDELHRAACDISAFPWRFPEVPGIGWYGMAWKTTFYRDKRIVYHCGEIEGYCSIELFLPDHDWGMYLLCNRHKPETPFLMELVYTAIDRYFGHPETDWAQRLHPYEKIFGGSCDDWMVNVLPGEPVPGTAPSQNLSAYTGTYEHPAYGTLEISLEDTLILHYKKWCLPLEHYHYDTFRVAGLKEDTLYYTLPLAFTCDAATGQIDGFTLPLDPTVSPIRFTRRLLCRHASEKDLPAVSAIYEELHTLEEAGQVHIGWERGVYPSMETAREALERGDLFVMEKQGSVIAAAVINRRQVPDYAKARWTFPCGETEAMVLHTLVVSPGCAKQGIGSAFVSFYEQYAASRGCRALRMDTNEINAPARALYRKLGYREVDIIPCVFNGIEGVQLVCLEKIL